MTIDQEIKQAFDAISLLLVFVTVFFDLKYKIIQLDLKEKIPAGDKEKKHLQDKLVQSLFINCGLLAGVNGVITYMFAPMIVKLVQNVGFALWHFDFMRTAFVAISIFTLIFFIWSILLTGQLIKKIRGIGKK